MRSQLWTAAEEALHTELTSCASDWPDCECVKHDHICSTVAVCWEIIHDLWFPSLPPLLKSFVGISFRIPFNPSDPIFFLYHEYYQSLLFEGRFYFILFYFMYVFVFIVVKYT